jgi:hypothetical protein
VENRSSHSRQSRGHKQITRAVSIVAILILSTLLPLLVIQPLPTIKAVDGSEYAQIAPNGLSKPPGWGIIANTEDNKNAPCHANEVSCGDIQLDVNRTGIAVRIEIPREFLDTVEVKSDGIIEENHVNENDTYFVESNIRSDRYYYNLIDESKHWIYGWRGKPSDGPCYKPDFPFFDPNAPWCLEIWNYLNGSFLTFTPPKFVRFIGLHAPTIAGKYNFTLFVADHTNGFGYPDFVHAWNTTFFVPVTLARDPATIKGSICYESLNQTGCIPIIGAKGVAFAINSSSMEKVARAYVNQTDGSFTLTGLAPNNNKPWGYYFTASAGVLRSGSQNISFSESDPLYPTCPYSKTSCTPIDPTHLDVNQYLPLAVSIHLRPSPVVTGTIRYVDAMNGVQMCPLGNPQYLEHSVTDHPWLESVGVTLLNITVEAYDNLQPSHIYRYQAVSNNAGCGDVFRIITAAGESYVGLDPYGTEFAGLPPPDLGYQIIVRVWITGYVQNTFLTFNSQNVINVGEIVMKSGALITGMIMFTESTDLSHPVFQSPHYSELNATGTATDKLLGGNVILEARYKSSTGEFRLGGVTVINGTGIHGNTTYASRQNITYAIIGFSEFYNRTSSGHWLCTWSTFPGRLVTDYCRDQGFGDPAVSQLDTRMSVFVRGYDQLSSSALTVYQGKLKEMNLLVVRGGILQIQLFSYDNRPGSRALQALQQWVFLNKSIAVRVRVYVFTSHMGVVGYVECALVAGGPCDVDKYSLKANFAGQNPSLREIWFYGQTPTRLAADTSNEPYYVVKAFTLGYVQAWQVTTPINRLDVRGAWLPLLIGNQIDITSPIRRGGNLGKILENDFPVGEVYVNDTDVNLAGAVSGNFSAETPTLQLPVYGFGGMVNNGELEGQGHFFYVSPHITPDSSLCQSNRCFDYGLDVGVYSAQIPEFGFNEHLMQFVSSPIVDLPDLYLEQGVIFSVIIMAKVISGIGPYDFVNGLDASLSEDIPLSWARVEAIDNSQQIDRLVPTLDGRYIGEGALFLPAGNYTIIFSSPFYQSWTYPEPFVVQWSQGPLRLLPDPLCPEGRTCPSSSATLSAASQLFLGTFSTLSQTETSTITVSFGATAADGKDGDLDRATPHIPRHLGAPR